MVRLEAALAITAIDVGAAEPAIPPLREHVRLKYRGAEAARALADIGPRAKEAIADLEELLKQDNPHTKLASAEAIAQARAVDPGEARPLELLRHLQRELAPPGHGGEAHRRLQAFF